jgi:ribosomal protein S5
VGVIAGDVLGRLLKHTGLMNFYTYNFMKKYTLNFTTATVPGAKKTRPGKPGRDFF